MITFHLIIVLFSLFRKIIGIQWDGKCSQGRREGAEHIPMFLLRKPRWP